MFLRTDIRSLCFFEIFFKKKDFYEQFEQLRLIFCISAKKTYSIALEVLRLIRNLLKRSVVYCAFQLRFQVRLSDRLLSVNRPSLRLLCFQIFIFLSTIFESLNNCFLFIYDDGWNRGMDSNLFYITGDCK